jgi:transposase
MIRYVGLDVHKRFIKVCIVDDSGKPIFRGQTSCLRGELIQFAKAKLKRTDRVALEATTNTWPVVEILRPMVAQIVVGNPLKIRAIAEAKIKTDKVDAEILAQLLRCDFLPSVWQPDDQTRRMRAWLTHRTALMAQKTRVKNQIQGLLGRLLIHSPYKLLWTKAGLAWLKDLELPAHERVVLDSQLRQLASVKQEIELLDQNLESAAQQEPKVHLLMTIPGVDYVVALGLLAALGDIGRFRDGDQAAAYLGLAPTTRQSAEHCYHGHITKRGNSQTRCLLTQSAQHASRHPGPIGAFFRRLTKRKTRNVAIIAVARKLVTIAFLMLKNNEPYRYARPELMRTKFTKLKMLSKGRRPANVRTAKQGLADVFQAAGLPPVTVPGELPKGEQRMLANRGLRKFVKDLYQPPPCQTGREATTKTSAAKSACPAGRAM